MEKNENYLEDLLEATPLSLMRIKGTWKYLPFEAKVKILRTFLDDKNKDRFKYTYQLDQLKDLAFEDENPYIRSLVAQAVSKPYRWNDREETAQDREDEARYNKVLADKNELVRSIAEEGLKGFPEANDETAAKFWNFSHTKRLMCISSKDTFDRLKGEVFAKILRYAAENLYPEKKISATEVIDVIQQYVAKDAMKEKARKAEKYARQFMDGYAEYSVGKDMEALWQTALELPDDFGFDLIEALPAKAGFMDKIPLIDLEKVSTHKLSSLFYRDDVGLNEFRRKIYAEPATDKNDSLRWAAISSIAFKLEDTDFKKLAIEKDDSKENAKHKFKELKLLAETCRGATLAQMEAIIDMVQGLPDDLFPGLSHSGEVVAYARMVQEGRARSLGERFPQELLEWRIYALASYLDNDFADNAFNFLKSDIVKGDTWATYLKIRPKILDKVKLHTHLPTFELDGIMYPTEATTPSKNNEGDNISEDIKPLPQISNLEAQIKTLQKTVKWIFWIGIILVLMMVNKY